MKKIYIFGDHSLVHLSVDDDDDDDDDNDGNVDIDGNTVSIHTWKWHKRSSIGISDQHFHILFPLFIIIIITYSGR